MDIKETEDYPKIVELIDDGYEHVIPVLDSKAELDRLYAKTKGT